MLKRSISLPVDEQNEDDKKASHLMFNTVSKGASRRTAAGVFFELLQLKTWDYIDLQQGESYGNIKILPGAKFAEDPPSK